MSLFHYIGSPVELEIGAFGSKLSKDSPQNVSEVGKIIIKELPENFLFGMENDISVWPDKTIIYDNLVDASEICISNIHNKTKDNLRKHLKNQYIYEISTTWCSFSYNLEHSNSRIDLAHASRKCVELLFRYIDERITSTSYFEIYSCWADEEIHMREVDLDINIEINDFILPSIFDLKDKQYICIAKSPSKSTSYNKSFAQGSG